MPEFLVFQLYGPMSSWGDIAVGEYRPDMASPSKSAVMGLLAAALGIRRNEDERHMALENGYAMAVCVESAGHLLQDFHTIQVPRGIGGWLTRKDELCFTPLHLNTILSRRDYRTDAVYIVAVWIKGNSSYTLEELQEALRRPYFVTCLGRKSCPPALPFHPWIVKNVNLKQALLQYPRDPIFKDRRLQDELRSFYWEKGGLSNDELGLLPAMMYPRHDRIHSRKRWQFLDRNEYYCTEPRREES